MRALIAATIVCGLAGAIAPAHAGDAVVDDALFGVNSGTGRAAACFIRHYDKAHLKAHPKQNVTDMVLMVDRWPAEEGGGYSASIGVEFRGLNKQLRVSGTCSSVEVGTVSLGCGIDCAGGIIGVRLRDADTVLVDIPDGARTWDPESDSDDTPAEAAFGSDDKTFKLTRTDLKECEPLAYDEALKALFANHG